MIDHMGFRVRDLAAARRFYEAAMAPIGLTVADNTEASFIVRRSGEWPSPFLWIGTDEPAFWSDRHHVSASPIHIAFQAPDKDSVNAFYAAAMKNGGRDNGGPGPRGPTEMNYYAAYVIDPDGNNIEAGFRGP